VNQFYVTKAEPCPKCGGPGKIQNPRWEGYLKAKAAGQVDVFLTQHRDQSWPVEQFWPCPKCKGAGEIRSETTLAEALAELGIRL
jgi:DnaJ-class molecular chaperone